jgi:hypothetical protein
MARPKFDGVIEAVRYSTDGNLSVARGYERHGAVWSDRIIFPRQELVDRLKQGRRFVTGVRKTYLGSVFETGSAVHYKNDHILVDDKASSHDLIPGVGIF